MLFTSITGVFAVLFAAVAAHPAPSATSTDASATSSMDTMHASTLPSAQALYERVYHGALYELLKRDSLSPPPIISAVPPRRLKPHYKVGLINDITSKAVRQLLPPTFPFPLPPFPLPHNIDIRSPSGSNFTWSNITDFDVGPNVTPTLIPPPDGVAPAPTAISHSSGVAPTKAKRSEPKDIRVSILEHAGHAGLSETDMSVLESTIDDAQEIVYAAQIRATNIAHERGQARVSNAKRGWCICKLFGCKGCSDKEW